MKMDLHKTPKQVWVSHTNKFISGPAACNIVKKKKKKKKLVLKMYDKSLFFYSISVDGV